MGYASAAVKGMKYNAIHMGDFRLSERLKWISAAASFSRSRDVDDPDVVVYAKGPPAPQAYDQLASAYRAAGFGVQARQILYRKHSDAEKYRIRNLGERAPREPVWRRAWAWLTDLGLWLWGQVQRVSIGFGYLPALAAFWLLILWSIGVWLFWVYFPPAAIVSPGQKAPGAMGVWDHLTFPMKLIIPGLNLTASNWRPSGGGVILGAILTIFGWFLTATVVTAVARVARRQ
ncbi:hypothetical protein [Streptacidiphilus anmyonensis]|uniref:hypothetical protein n=1 Tax=Streptacidiphilus anmyonensis TaxID=405782 RepID=UPI00128C36E7|nr:hypothetical protein [Streptacidiphilus anmyonensis]